MEISQRIVDYAIWYYLKYYPSKYNLRKKLIEKFWESSENWKKYGWIWEEEIDYIMNERMQSIIAEDEVIIAKINAYKRRGKSLYYIRWKLYERHEPKELIEKYLIEAFEEGEDDLIIREYEKLKGKYEGKKIVEKLIRKGFKYDDVMKVVKLIDGI